MKKNVQILLAGLLAAAVLFAPVAGIAQEKPKAAPGNDAPGKQPGKRSTPFRGKVTAVDATAKTVTVGARVFHLSAESKLTKKGQTMTVADIVVGDEIAGNYTTSDDGKLMARTVRVGPKPDQAPGEKPAKSKKSTEKSKAKATPDASDAKE